MSAPADTLPPATRMGAVHLGVADLARSVAFYERALGLRVHDLGAGRATLGTGDEDLLVLREEPGAAPARGFSGLFHFALLVPERADLARWLAHAARERVPLTGMSDHAVSEALYLRDPDEHGIEIYRDRPREQWEGQVDRLMTTLPLDVQDLLNELDDPRTEPFDGLADGTTMGHVHLRVAQVDPVVAFYRDVLGFGLMASLGPQAAFLGAGGYHHHLGANTWESAGAPQAPAGVATLEQATILLPDAAAVDAAAGRLSDAGHEPQADDGGVLIRDPSGNPLRLAAER
jgi:catechol 2,3-dioxygenase